MKQLPARPEPRHLRLEDACRARQQSQKDFVAHHLGERTKDMVADGEKRSQQRALLDTPHILIGYCNRS